MKPTSFNYTDYARLQTEMERKNEYVNALKAENERLQKQLAAYEDIGTVEDFQRLAPKMVSCPKGWQGTRDTRYICPCCKKAVRNDESFCHKCGQALLFPKQVYDKENNKFWLDFGEEAEAALAKEDTANDSH